MKVAVSGGFDPIHKGHICYIEEALRLGDELLVILTRDDQLEMKNGKYATDYEERELILRWGLRGCGKPFEIVKNIDKTIKAYESLLYYKPDIFAKGGDRTPDNMPSEEIEACNTICCKLVYNVGGDKIQASSFIRDKLSS